MHGLFSGVAMGCTGCAYSGISYLLSDTECSQINWNLRFSARTHSTVVLALKDAEWPNCWFSNQPACHTHRGKLFGFKIEGDPPSKLCTSAHPSPWNLATPLGPLLSHMNKLKDEEEITELQKIGVFCWVAFYPNLPFHYWPWPWHCWPC